MRIEPGERKARREFCKLDAQTAVLEPSVKARKQKRMTGKYHYHRIYDSPGSLFFYSSIHPITSLLHLSLFYTLPMFIFPLAILAS